MLENLTATFWPSIILLTLSCETTQPLPNSPNMKYNVIKNYLKFAILSNNTLDSVTCMMQPTEPDLLISLKINLMAGIDKQHIKLHGA